MYVLALNSMMDRCENRTRVAIAHTKERLEEFLTEEKVESYKDEAPGGWGNERQTHYSYTKNFRKGGPLEWFNPPWNRDECIFEVPSVEKYLEIEMAKYHQLVAAGQLVPDTEDQRRENLRRNHADYINSIPTRFL